MAAVGLPAGSGVWEPAVSGPAAAVSVVFVAVAAVGFAAWAAGAVLLQSVAAFVVMLMCW